jgi:hypothetical protein
MHRADCALAKLELLPSKAQPNHGVLLASCIFSNYSKCSAASVHAAFRGCAPMVTVNESERRYL